MNKQIYESSVNNSFFLSTTHAKWRNWSITLREPCNIVRVYLSPQKIRYRYQTYDISNTKNMIHEWSLHLKRKNIWSVAKTSHQCYVTCATCNQCQFTKTRYYSRTTHPRYLRMSIDEYQRCNYQIRVMLVNPGRRITFFCLFCFSVWLGISRFNIIYIDVDPIRNRT